MPFSQLSSSRSIVNGHTITIEQAPLVDRLDTERPQYCVNIFVDGSDIPKVRKFFDPISFREYEDCSKYLDCVLEDGTYTDENAELMSQKVTQYGSDLFNGLGLGPISDDLKGAEVAIEIVESGPINGFVNNIHRIRWEQLENENLWVEGSQPDQLKTVSVRRIVPPVRKKVEKHKEIRRTIGSREKESGRINILLIIARRLKKENDGKYYEIDPAITISHILQMKRRLEKEKAPHQIALEVVRPGTFAALKFHLETKPVGYFDIVHFDLHGAVRQDSRYALMHDVLLLSPMTMLQYRSSSHKAYLKFLSEDPNNNRLVEIPAECVAKLLSERGVTCSVLNACKSASPEKGNSSNLSHLFAGYNSFKILAMSYNISETAIKLLCEEFYNCLFSCQQSFSEAASRARKALRDDDVRMYPRVVLPDWFVPVTYAFNDDGLIIKNSWRNKWRRSQLYLHLPERNASSGSSFVSSQATEAYSDNMTFKGLHMTDLEFERQLILNRVIRISGPASIENKKHLDCLSDLWKVTHFSWPFKFSAYEYLNGQEKLLEAVSNYIWGNTGSSQQLPVALKNTTEGREMPRPIIIIEDAESLFETDMSNDQLNLRSKLNAFLVDVYITQDETYGSMFRTPYLIFVSIKDIQAASIAVFGRLGGVQFSRTDQLERVEYKYK